MYGHDTADSGQQPEYHALRFAAHTPAVIPFSLLRVFCVPDGLRDENVGLRSRGISLRIS
ncbi:MAG: hypothetical protein DMG48_17655 [Acidobacteria bacterium]|nr:MAG: hypothetical protein DMG48_17655 [Acidobacteriota bacterium]